MRSLVEEVRCLDEFLAQALQVGSAEFLEQGHTGCSLEHWKEGRCRVMRLCPLVVVRCFGQQVCLTMQAVHMDWWRMAVDRRTVAVETEAM